MNFAEELAAAQELHAYIVNERFFQPINAAEDYNHFRLNISTHKQILASITPDVLCLRFNSLLRFEGDLRMPRNCYIYAVWAGGNARPRGQQVQPPELTRNPNTRLGIDTNSGLIMRFFNTDDSNFNQIILRNRDEYLRSGFLRENKLEKYEYLWAYNYLARHTVRLSGLISTNPSNYHDLHAAIRNALENHPDEELRQEVPNIEIFCFLLKKPNFAEALCYFTMVHIDRADITEHMFLYLVGNVVPTGQLRLGTNVLRIDRNVKPNPWAPHEQAIWLIPDIVKGRYVQMTFEVPREATPPAPLNTGSTSPPPPSPPPPLPLAPVATAGPAIQTIEPAMPIAEPTMPDVEPTMPNVERSALAPTPYGALESGLSTPVMDPSKLLAHQRNQKELFQQLKQVVLDTSTNKAKNAWFFEVTGEGCFVLYKHKDFILGEGGEAKVYLGAHIDLDYASDDRDVVRQIFAERAKAVAIKQYKNRDSKIEINTFRKLRSGVKGVINYIENFDMNDELYTVQELGLITLDKASVLASFQEKLCMLRGACLAVRELHKRSGGPIVHRDIRPPNLMLTDTGHIKVVDFGISRVLPETSRTIQTVTATPLSVQPYEVLVVLNRIIAMREEAAKNNPDQLAAQMEEEQGDIPVSTSADIFMLGLVLYKVLTGLDAMTSSDIMLRRPPNLDRISALFCGGHLLAHLLSGMLSHDTTTRPSIDQVLEHPYFRTWEENQIQIQGLYRELHSAEEVQYSENFKLLEMILEKLERETNWKACMDNMPSVLRSKIKGSKEPPRIRTAEGQLLPHPLPNLHSAIQWLRHFFVHFGDNKTLPYIYNELKASVKESEAAGEFIYTHNCIAWLLPRLWECRVRHQHKLREDKEAWDEEWEKLQKKNEAKIQEFKSMERKSKALFAIIV